MQKCSNRVDRELDAGKNLCGVHVICNKSREMSTHLSELGMVGGGWEGQKVLASEEGQQEVPVRTEGKHLKGHDGAARCCALPAAPLQCRLTSIGQEVNELPPPSVLDFPSFRSFSATNSPLSRISR